MENFQTPLLLTISETVTRYGGDSERKLSLLVFKCSYGDIKACLFFEGDVSPKVLSITTHPKYVNWLVKNASTLLTIPVEEWWNDRATTENGRFTEFHKLLEKL